ncbi:MAG: AAA family ATPase [Cyanobacteria bacterium SZAS LIN-3]|nr:AAA family ATPase [Cyanobacteria bacterium SZAS LIN-3]
MASRYIKEIRLRHFRSFEDARIPLDDQTILIGRNGSGKSTIIYAFEFLKSALAHSLSRAVEQSGGIAELRQRQNSPGIRYDISVAINLSIGLDEFVYGFRLGSKKGLDSESQWVIKEEVLKSNTDVSFRRTEGTLKSSVDRLLPSFERDSLVLPLVAGANKTLNSIYRAIRSIESFKVSPEAIRAEPPIGALNRMEKDGRNSGDLLKALQSQPESMEWLLSHLSAITPGLVSVSADQYSGRRVIRFQQRGKGISEIYEFTGRNMPDGTLRALALLVAALSKPAPALIVIDEISDSLHPHAVEVLIDALFKKPTTGQILFSTHDSDVLAFPSVRADMIRVVDWQDGVSKVFPIERNLIDNPPPYDTLGDLFRTNALFPAQNALVNDSDFYRLSGSRNVSDL